jgi:hypothetical protein
VTAISQILAGDPERECVLAGWLRRRLDDQRGIVLLPFHGLVQTEQVDLRDLLSGQGCQAQLVRDNLIRLLGVIVEVREDLLAAQ